MTSVFDYTGAVRWVVTLVLCAAVLGTSDVDAQSSTEAEAESLIQEGVELRRQNDLVGALERFRRAHETYPSGRSHAQLGLVYQEQGRWVDAFRHLRQALDSGHEWVERYRADIEQALGRVVVRVGFLDIQGNVEGAEVVVEERVVTLPLSEPIPLVAGSVRLVVRAEGYEPTTISPVVVAGELSREIVELRPLPSATQPPVVPNLGGSTTESPALDDERGPANPHAILGWTFAGMAGAAAIASGVLRRFAYLRAQDWNSDACLLAGQTRAEACGDHLEASQRLRDAQRGMYAVCGATAITGALLLILDRRRRLHDDSREGSTETSRVQCVDGPGIIGVTCGLDL